MGLRRKRSYTQVSVNYIWNWKHLMDNMVSPGRSPYILLLYLVPFFFLISIFLACCPSRNIIEATLLMFQLGLRSPARRLRWPNPPAHSTCSAPFFFPAANKYFSSAITYGFHHIGNSKSFITFGNNDYQFY